ncbi:hypothetical protein D3C86_1783530 [compost metagenome]
MNVDGLSSQMSWSQSRARPARPWKRPSTRSVVPPMRASWSTSQKPALCRVASYSAPGLPRPTMSLIMR